MPTFNLGRMLEDEGLELLNVLDDGSYRVADSEGRERTLNTNKLLADMKLNPKEVDIKVNTPNAPLDVSPVGLIDRAKMAVGNTRGQVGYLKQKFQDVMVHPDNGLIVKNKGVWQKVDQDTMDSWELTKDIVEGAVGFSPTLIGGTIGAAKGAAAGSAVAPGVGSVVGGIVGAGAGAGAAEGIRTSLGRLAGTYDATPEEQLKDIGWEALLNSGGQTLPLAVKPTVKVLAEAGKFIGKHAAPATKEIFASVYGSITGAGQTATRILFDNPDDVAREVAGALQTSGKDTLKAIDVLKAEQIETLDKVLNMAKPALDRKFQTLQGDLLSKVGNTFEADVGAEVNTIFKQMEAAGIGKFKGTYPATKGPGGVSYVSPKFELSSLDEIEQLVAQGRIPDRIGGDTMEALGKLVNELNLYARTPAQKGVQAAKSVLDVKRAISNAAFAIKDKVNPVVAGKLTEYSAAFDTKLSQVFHKQNLGQQFDDMNAFYKGYKDVVKEADRVLQGTFDTEILVNKLISNPGSQGIAKEFRSRLSELVGPQGDKLLQSIIVKEGAKGHVRFVPNPSRLTPIVGGVGGAFAVGSGAVGLPVAAAAATQASPRLVMKQVQYGHKLLDLLRGMNNQQRIQWLQNSPAVAATLRTAMDAAYKEDETTEQMLMQAGVK